MILRKTAIILMIGLSSTTASCTNNGPGTVRRLPATSAQSLAQMCAHPTTSASTRTIVAVGARGAPRVGPITVHPYPYSAGYPTKVLLHPVHAVDAALRITGRSCRGQVALRFMYGSAWLAASSPPYSQQQLATLGTTDVQLPPQAGGKDYTGYMLFSDTGPWLVTVSTADGVLGSVLINVG